MCSNLSTRLYRLSFVDYSFSQTRWQPISRVSNILMAHFKTWTHLCSPGMFLRRTLCRNCVPEFPFQLLYLVVCRNWCKSTYQAHIDFFHTNNHIRIKSLSHCWKGENKGSNLHYFLAQESSIKADFWGILARKHVVFLKREVMAKDMHRGCLLLRISPPYCIIPTVTFMMWQSKSCVLSCKFISPICTFL